MKKNELKELIKNNIFNLTIFVTVLVFLCFVFQDGYFSYFKIHSTLIFFDKTYFFSLFTMGIIIFSIPFIISSFFNMNYKRKHNSFLFYLKYLILFLIKIGGSSLISFYILLCISLNMVNIGSWKLLLEYSSICSFIYFTFSILFQGLNKLKKDKIDKIAFSYFLFIIAFFSLYKIASNLGYDSAKEKKSFLLTDDYVLIYNSSDQAVVCNYNIKDNEEEKIIFIDNTEFKKISINDINLSIKTFDKVQMEQ